MKEVTYKLKVTSRTIAFHKYQIMAALGAQSNADLLQYALRHHLIAA